jgi:hypothetical protein
MELREALTQIAEIRQQMARGQVFRGYRAATTAFSGLVALLVGVVECWAAPALLPGTFVLPWVVAAGLCILVVGIEMVIRTRRSQSHLQRQLTLLAVEQFMPSVVAGGMVTWVICGFLPALVWMLPGLWMVLFALGVFASARLLPREVFAAAGFYLLAGVTTLIAGRNAPVTLLNVYMGSVFAVGQGAIAAILYFRLERPHD